MPAGRGKDAERLAAAIEQGTPPGSVADAELARDLEIVAMLRSQGTAYRPRPDAKAAAKRRLMAAFAEQHAGPDTGPPPTAVDRPTAAERTAPIAPLVSAPLASGEVTTEMGRVADSATPDGPGTEHPVDAPDLTAPRRTRTGRHSMPSRPGARASGATRPANRSLRRRAVLVGSAALLAMIAIAGGNLASRDALPGDALYAMKRVSEDVGLATTFDDGARAQRNLDLASTRLAEVERLVALGSAGEADPELVEAAMLDFDASTGEGSRGLLGGTEAVGPAQLGDLRTWAADQAARLSVLRSSLPVPAQDQADGSIALLDRLVGRAEALEARSTCSDEDATTVDDLGRLPGEGSCVPRADESDDPAAATTEDGSPSPTTGGEGATDGVDPTTGTSAPGESTTPDGGLLPSLGPDGLPLPGLDGEAPTSTTTSSAPTGDGQISVPLPLVPPIQLPPLLPGLPGVSIG